MKKNKFIIVFLCLILLFSFPCFALSCSDCGSDNTYYHSVDSTCFREGFEEFECYNCGFYYYYPYAIRSHRMVLTTTVQPSFTSDGYELYTCSRCGLEERKELSMLACDHQYKEIDRIEPTDNSAGTITYKCSLCGEVTYSDLDYVSPVPSETAGLAKALFSGIWGLFGIYVPGFNFTIGQFWIGVALCSVSVIVIKLLLGIGGGGVSSRTGSTSKPKISDNRKRDEY